MRFDFILHFRPIVIENVSHGSARWRVPRGHLFSWSKPGRVQGPRHQSTEKRGCIIIIVILFIVFNIINHWQHLHNPENTPQLFVTTGKSMFGGKKEKHQTEVTLLSR